MTWTSPDGKTHTQLNHIIIKQQVEELTFRQEGRKISKCLILSDRQLLIASLTIKLHKTTGKFWRPRQHLSWNSETASKPSRKNQWNSTSALSTIGQREKYEMTSLDSEKTEFSKEHGTRYQKERG